MQSPKMPGTLSLIQESLLSSPKCGGKHSLKGETRTIATGAAARASQGLSTLDWKTHCHFIVQQKAQNQLNASCSLSTCMKI